MIFLSVLPDVLLRKSFFSSSVSTLVQIFEFLNVIENLLLLLLLVFVYQRVNKSWFIVFDLTT